MSVPSLADQRTTSSAPAQTSDITQVWLGSIDDPSGFSDELRGFLRSLEAHGQRPVLVDLPGVPRKAELTASDQATFEKQKRREAPRASVAVHHYVPGVSQPVIAEMPNVARAMFETDRLPERRIPLLMDRDEIWVPAQFNVETFERAGIPRDRLRVVGETIDFDLFSPGGVTPYRLPTPADRFTFLTNFAFSERKAWRQLLRAWALAFTADDDVCLVLKAHAEGRDDRHIRVRIDEFLTAELGPRWKTRVAPIRVMTDILGALEMPRLYAAADAYVLASRGEGWGRPYMEAMAMGLPTIASRWSGNLEFMHDGNSWLVDGEVVACEHGQEVFGDPCTGHRWFEPDVDALAAQMRAVAGDREGARERAGGARAELIERFGPEPIARRLTELTTSVHERHAERRARPASCAILGPAGSVSSLAVVNDALADGLQRRGHNLARRAAGQNSHYSTFPTISHSWPPVFDLPGQGPAVVVLPWEYGAPPASWVEDVTQFVDRVWVPSAYVRDGYVEGGMPAGAIEVVPNGVDTDHFVPEGPVRAFERRAACTFLFVGGTIWRKGADVLLQAWAEAFGPDDDVQLIIKDFGTETHYRGQSVIDAAALAARTDLAPVVHLTDEVPYGDMPALYRAADVLVAPYRAEGFCLPALEAMACGLPVIHNAAGPTAEFVADDAGWALPGTRVPLPPRGAMKLAGEGWAHEVGHDDLVAALRDAYNNGDERRLRAVAARERALDWTWERATDAAEASLATLAAEALEPIRHVASAAVVESRGTRYVYAPDWARDDWSATLTAWIQEVPADRDVTLVLYAGDADVDTLAPRLEETIARAGAATDVPDLALCVPSEHDLDALVLGADGVLLDAADDAEPPTTFIRRRARRLVHANPAELRRLAGGLALHAPVPNV
ncbi:MAG TPA: glycosyltransferase family 4 protein [Baekduia sp.]